MKLRVLLTAIQVLTVWACSGAPATESPETDAASGGESTVTTAPPAPEEPQAPVVASATAAAEPAAPAAPPAPATTTHPPVACSGGEEVSLSHVIIDAPGGAAVTASGRCRFTCTACSIRGGAGAITVSGQAVLELMGGTVTGTPAIVASGRAVVRTYGATVEGEARTSGRAEVVPMNMVTAFECRDGQPCPP